MPAAEAGALTLATRADLVGQVVAVLVQTPQEAGHLGLQIQAVAAAAAAQALGAPALVAVVDQVSWL